MPIAIIIIGVVLVIASIRGRQLELANLIRKDITGSNSFLPWFGVLILLYLFGKIGPLEEVSKYMLALVLVVLFLTSGRGFFDQFNKQLKEIRNV